MLEIVVSLLFLEQQPANQWLPSAQMCSICVASGKESINGQVDQIGGYTRAPSRRG